MNSITKIFLVCMAMAFANLLHAQKQATDTTMIVNGVCDMCKKTIETAALKSGAASAHWDEDTKILQLSYNPEKTSLEKIDQAIRKTGYDTAREMADQKAYDSLHDCCKYRDPKVIDDHKKE